MTGTLKFVSAVQDSIEAAEVADHAIDGDYDGRFFRQSCTHPSINNGYHWWKGTLAQNSTTGRIVGKTGSTLLVFSWTTCGVVRWHTRLVRKCTRLTVAAKLGR